MTARLVVALSGSGTTLENLFEHIERGELDARVDAVLSSRSDAFGLERARRRGIPAVTVPGRDHPTARSLSEALFAEIRRYEPDWVVLAGFMRLLHIPDDFAGRVVNIHPALIPSFCGRGYYGNHVHEAVIARGAKVSGCTVHLCDNEYDHGPIVMQKAVVVEDDDTAETLAERVQAAEREIYPRAIQLLIDGRVQVNGRRTRII
jgi:formyltetrahydrofolate-dependent phosphoribosylglycinamide formyltransferase